MVLDAIKKVLFLTPGEDQLGSGALKADAGAADNKKKFDQELIAAAYNGASGYVSPPSNNIMGFGPAANQNT